MTGMVISRTFKSRHSPAKNMSRKLSLLFFFTCLSGCVTVNNDNVAKFADSELCDFLNPLIYVSVVPGEKDVVRGEIKRRGISCTSRTNDFLRKVGEAAGDFARREEAERQRFNEQMNSSRTGQPISTLKAKTICNLAAENKIDRFTTVCVYKCIGGTATKEISGIHSCSSTESF